MKISNWSIVGMLAGSIFAIGSFVRYYIIYTDLSEVVIGVLLGSLVFSTSWLYNKVLQLGNTLVAVEDYIADNQELVK